MANYHKGRICKLCAVPHGKAKCPVADLNAAQELEAKMRGDDISLGLTPELEHEIRALRSAWRKEIEPPPAMFGSPQPSNRTACGVAMNIATAAERLRHAWGVRT